MNNQKDQNHDSIRELMLMSELESGEPISQREIAGRLGIALGLVNTYLKKLASKGYVSIKTFPRNRYAYLLTPQGLAEKSRLAFQQVGFFNRIFRIVREDSLSLFQRLKADGINEVYFCGVDEFSEIAYLSLCEAGLVLRGVVDTQSVGEAFLSHTIAELENIGSDPGSHIAVTSFRRTDDLKNLLIEKGVQAENLHTMAVPL